MKSTKIKTFTFAKQINWINQRKREKSDRKVCDIDGS